MKTFLLYSEIRKRLPKLQKLVSKLWFLRVRVYHSRLNWRLFVSKPVSSGWSWVAAANRFWYSNRGHQGASAASIILLGSGRHRYCEGIFASVLCHLRFRKSPTIGKCLSRSSTVFDDCRIQYESHIQVNTGQRFPINQKPIRLGAIFTEFYLINFIALTDYPNICNTIVIWIVWETWIRKWFNWGTGNFKSCHF